MLKDGRVIYYVIPIQMKLGVEPTKQVSKTHLLKCHDKLDFSNQELRIELMLWRCESDCSCSTTIRPEQFHVFRAVARFVRQAPS